VACRESYALDLTDRSCELVVCEIKLADNTSLIVQYRSNATSHQWRSQARGDGGADSATPQNSRQC